MDHSAFVEHGYCLLWEPGLVWLHVISDIIIGITYYSIPVALFYFIYKRRDIPFMGVFILFAAFIFACGTTHFFSAYTIFVPAYWPEGIVKAITAVVSTVAVFILIPMIPKAIALPSLTKALDEITVLNKELGNKVEELKMSEEALRRSEERFRLLYERAPVPYQSLDGNGFFIEINDTWLDKMGYSRDEVIGKHFSDFMTPESKELQKKKLPCFVDSGEIRDAEFEMIKKDGSHIIASFDGKIGYDDKGHFQQTHCVFQDITERRKSEDEKRKLEEQLRQAQKMEAIGQLAGGIAHDFNNVLSAIMGYGYLLKKKIGEDSPMIDDVEQILESADRAAEVTRNLLAFSRKQIMNIQPVDINEIIRKIGKMLSRLIGEDIEIITTFAAEKIICMADAGQIEQVLINLATNSRDAMPRGGTLTINAEPVHLDEAFIRAHGYGNPGTYALVTVSDTGAGIAREEVDKIFDPFFTTKEIGKGTGLGLAMAYGIIKQHDGYITVYSETGRGTTFKIYLPEAESKEVVPVLKALEAPPLRGTETILVAEDDEKLRKLSEVVLTGNGYKVILARDGEDAIRKFVDNKDQIQLVIIDMIMPKKGGKEVFDAINGIKSDVKVLFSSGYAADRIENIDLLKDNRNFITKPVLPGALLRKVRDILDS